MFIPLPHDLVLQLAHLIEGLEEPQLAAMALGLGHSLSRYKLKFSPDKVDTMIVQAIGLLDDLDKEINTYAMRVREWYGWHFPEVCASPPLFLLIHKRLCLLSPIPLSRCPFPAYLSLPFSLFLRVPVWVFCHLPLPPSDLPGVVCFLSSSRSSFHLSDGQDCE